MIIVRFLPYLIDLNLHIMVKYFIIAVSAVWLCIILTNCSSESLILEPQQNITTVTYTLTPVGGGESVVFDFEDEDGSGDLLGIATGGTLTKSTVYQGEIEIHALSNESIVNITEAIRVDGRDNQFFYTSLNPAIVISYDDTDVDLDGNPIGILTNLTTVNNNGEGNITLTLKHNPDKEGLAVSGGNVSLSGGRTDIEIDFPVIVQ